MVGLLETYVHLDPIGLHATYRKFNPKRGYLPNDDEKLLSVTQWVFYPQKVKVPSVVG